MTFFTPEDEQKRKQALEERARKTAANDAYQRVLADQLLPETLRQIREAYTTVAGGVTIKHKTGSIMIHPDALSTKQVDQILQELVARQTGLECNARYDSEYDEITVSVSFPR